MATIQSNQVSAELSDEDGVAVHAAFDLIFSKLPFLLGLTMDQRKSILKINDGNKTFTEDAVTASENNSNILPAYFSTSEMSKDLHLFTKLDPFVLRAKQLFEKLSDTQMLAGSEAYISALAAYRLFAAAAKAGVPGADAVYKLLKARFAGQGNFKDSTPPPAEPGA